MKPLLKKVAITSVLILASTPTLALPFLQVYELAEKSDPEILAASFEYQAALNTRPQTRSSLLPNITLDVFSQQVEQDSTSLTNPAVDYDANGYEISLTQSIYNHDLYLKLEQTDISIASAAAAYEAAKQALIIRVAEAYYTVLAAEDNLVFAKAEKRAIGQQLEQTRQRFDVGLIAVTDVKESQAQYDISVASEIQAENLLSTSRETLRSIIGQLPESLNVLAKEIPLLIPEPANINEWGYNIKEK